MWPQSHGQWDGNQSDNVYSGKMTIILHGHSNFRAATQRALDNFLWLSKCDPTFFFLCYVKGKPRVSLLFLQTAILGSQRSGRLVLTNLAAASVN